MTKPRPNSRHSPFGPAVPAILSAMAFALAALVWIAADTALPGGRWLAVHFFTLGVVTNLVLAFSEHFGRTLTHTPAASIRWQAPTANAGILVTLFGVQSGERIATALGATLVTAVVLASYVRLHRMRKQSLGARFSWIVRVYERAHGAFVHGAILGLLMGVGVMRGSWYLAARTAHLHINILGWAGLTLLATLVFFGPTIVRTRIVDGADERAAPALRKGASGLTIATLLLLSTGVGAPAATVLRIASAAAMAVYARAVTVVCLPVATAARGAKSSATRWPIIAASTWFPIVAWADVAVIATATWRWLDALGLAMLLGVLGQTIAAVLTYLAPMLRSGTSAERAALLSRLARGASSRTIAFNIGVASIVVATVIGDTVGGRISQLGWILVAGSLAWLLGAGTSRMPQGDV